MYLHRTCGRDNNMRAPAIPGLATYTRSTGNSGHRWLRKAKVCHVWSLARSFFQAYLLSKDTSRRPSKHARAREMNSSQRGYFSRVPAGGGCTFEPPSAGRQGGTVWAREGRGACFPCEGECHEYLWMWEWWEVSTHTRLHSFTNKPC